MVGSTASGDVLSALAPALGISVLTQAGLAQALKIGDREIERRRALVIEQRTRLLRALHDLPVDAPDSQANFVWLHASGLTGAQLTGALEQGRRDRRARRPAGRRRPRARLDPRRRSDRPAAQRPRSRHRPALSLSDFGPSWPA